MAVIPDDRVGKIEFAEQRVAAWTANSVAIGSTSAAVTAWAAKVTAARAAFQAQKVAQNAAKAATNTLNMAMVAMNNATSDVVKQIRTQASLVGDGVYTLAEVPPPAIPGPVGRPGTPTNLKWLLKPNGSVELKFKCKNPVGCHGVIYQIYRKVELTGEYTYLGGTGNREFTDLGVPAGAPNVLYQIQATRSTAVGDAAEFLVKFGVIAVGPGLATSSKGIAAKIAA